SHDCFHTLVRAGAGWTVSRRHFAFRHPLDYRRTHDGPDRIYGGSAWPRRNGPALERENGAGGNWFGGRCRGLRFCALPGRNASARRIGLSPFHRSLCFAISRLSAGITVEARTAIRVEGPRLLAGSPAAAHERNQPRKPPARPRCTENFPDECG